MMKVLFITNIPSPYRIEFFNELGKRCDLTVWFEAESEANRQWKFAKEKLNFRHEFLKGYTFGLDKHVNWSIFRRLRENRFDIYIMGCYSSPTEIAAIGWLKAKKIPFLLNSDGGFVSTENKWKFKLKRLLISSANGWLSSGKPCTDYLIHYGAKQEAIYEYPFASLSYSAMERTPMTDTEKEKFKLKEGIRGKMILCVGQFIPRKGIGELIESFQMLSNEDVTLVIVGGGPLKEEYEKQIARLGLQRVVLKDFMSREKLIDYYKSADVFAMPTKYDVWGLVINEAITFGLPIVSTIGAGASYSLVQNGVNGFTVDIGDMEGLLRKSALLIRNEGLRSRFAQASYSIGQRYTISEMSSRHVEILETFRYERLNRELAITKEQRTS